MERLVRFLFGDDVFISYSRRDGARYATGLARELTRRKFACRIDFWETVPGVEIPGRLRRHIRRSGLLVIVGSPGACSSAHVASEIREFRPTRRNIVPIAVAAPVERAVWFAMLSGLKIDVEPDPLALDTGSPAASVIDRITDSCDFVRRNSRLRRSFMATLGATLLLVAVTSGWSYVRVSRALDQVNAATKRESAATMRAQTATAADNEAEIRARDASERAGAAEDRAQGATADAVWQEQLASSRRVVLEIDRRRAQTGFTSAVDLHAAIRSGRQLVSLMQQAEAADGLSRMLALLPRLHAATARANLGPTVMSRDGRWIAAVGDSHVEVWEAPGLTEAVRFNVPSAVTGLVFSAGGDALVSASGQQIEVFDLQSGARTIAVQAPSPVSLLALSPDGRQLAAADGSSIYLWDLPRGETLTVSAEGRVDNLVFGPASNYLAAKVYLDGLGDELLVVDLNSRQWKQGPTLRRPERCSLSRQTANSSAPRACPRPHPMCARPVSGSCRMSSNMVSCRHGISHKPVSVPTAR